MCTAGPKQSHPHICFGMLHLCASQRRRARPRASAPSTSQLTARPSLRPLRPTLASTSRLIPPRKIVSAAVPERQSPTLGSSTTLQQRRWCATSPSPPALPCRTTLRRSNMMLTLELLCLRATRRARLPQMLCSAVSGRYGWLSADMHIEYARLSRTTTYC